MSDLQQRKEYIKEKRSTTEFRDFVKEIVSWFPVVFHKTQGSMSRYPDSDRIGSISSNKDFEVVRDALVDWGQEVDETIPFFEQFHALVKSIPLGATIKQMAGENTDYADSVVASSNAYLSSVLVNDCTDTLYSFVVFDYCKTVIDSLRVGTYSENIYNSVGVIKSTNIFYSRYITNSSNMWFSANCMGCHDCIGCIGLENKSWCIRNEQYSKEEYQKKKEELLFNKQGFENIVSVLPVESNNYGSRDITGNHVTMSSDVENGYFVNRLQDGRNVICVGGQNQESHFYDVFDAGITSSDMYGLEGAGYFSNNLYCSSQIEKSSNIFYSYYLNNCSFCFGCVGLRNKSYCILNKQYTKEEWLEKVDEICVRMKNEGTLGDFFPAWMNPFYFNDTAASLIEDFTKEEVVDEGYLRRDKEIAVDIPEWMEVVEVNDLNQYENWDENKKRYIDPAILKKVIKDDKGNVYRVIKMEYDFLVKHGLPLPRKHWLNRLKGHFKIK